MNVPLSNGTFADVYEDDIDVICKNEPKDKVARWKIELLRYPKKSVPVVHNPTPKPVVDPITAETKADREKAAEITAPKRGRKPKEKSE